MIEALVGCVIGISVTCNLFLYLEVKRLMMQIDNLHVYIEKEIEAEEEEVWQSMS